MENVHPNRVGGFFDAMLKTPVRSPAQVKASQENGRLSHGPVTPEGKAITRVNAFKHGLRSTRVRPPSDARGDDRRYRQIHRQLIAELRPTTFTQRAAIDLLTCDFLQLCRARQMIEVLMRPQSLPEKDLARYTQLQAAQKTLRLIDRVLPYLDTGTCPACSVAQAKELAAMLATAVTSLAEYVNDEEAIPLADMNKDERAEFEHYERQWKAVRPHQKRLLNSNYVLAVLVGDKPGKPAEMRAIQVLLTEARTRSAGRLRGEQAFLDRVEALAEATLMGHAKEPEKLLVFQRYVGTLERSISTKLAQFNR